MIVDVVYYHLRVFCTKEFVVKVSQYRYIVFELLLTLVYVYVCKAKVISAMKGSLVLVRSEV